MNVPYTIRRNCMICNHTELSKFFDKDYSTFLSFSLFHEIKDDAINIPFNIVSCNNCFTIQTLYIGDINIVYGDNRVDAYGNTKNDINVMFSKFIIQNKLLKTPIEIGACTNSLSKMILENIDTKYTIIEPGYKGEYVNNLNIISDYCENIDFNLLEGNTVIMSAVFEHFYTPLLILDKLRKAKNIEYVYLCHPNFEYYCNNDIANILNFEHIYYIELDFLKKLFKMHGFDIEELYDYKNNYYFLKFVKVSDLLLLNDINFSNTHSLQDTTRYFDRMHRRIMKLNNILEDKSSKYYIWPASAHTVTLFMNGLNWQNLSGCLDNSPNKIGKYLYGYNLKCESMNDKLLDNTREKITIILSGAGLYLDEIHISNSNLKIIHFNTL